MVTLVTDADGFVLHDCAEAGCTVSWDGYALVAFAYDDGGGTVQHFAAGDPLPGRVNPDPNVWTVDRRTARSAR